MNMKNATLAFLLFLAMPCCGERQPCLPNSDVNVEPIKQQKINTQSCIAQCLELDFKDKEMRENCTYRRETGKTVGDTCKEDEFEDSVPQRKIMCTYETEQKWTKNLLKMPNIKVCTHIEYMYLLKFDKVRNDLALSPSYDADFEEQVVNVKELKIKIIARLGSWGEESIYSKHLSKVANDDKLRKKFAGQVRDLLVENGFDGINIFWMYPSCPEMTCGGTKDHDAVVKLAKDLSEVLYPEKKEIFFWAALSNAQMPFFAGNIYSPMAPFVDNFVFECYNYGGFITPFIAVSTNLKTIMDNFKGFISKIGGDKRVMKKAIIGFKAEIVHLEMGSPKASKLGSIHNMNTKRDRSLSYGEACSRVKSTNKNYTVVKNPETMNYAFNPFNGENNKSWFSYDDAESLKAKINYLLKDLGGAGIWIDKLHYDDTENKCGCGKLIYLRTIGEILKGGDCKFTPCL